MMNSSEVIAPSIEKDSLILHSQNHCSYGKCSYCPNFKEGKRARFNVGEFKEFLKEESKKYIADKIDSIFIAEGNALGMEQRHLLEIMKALHHHFPEVKSIALYGSSRSVLKKSLRELQQLREAGMTRIHMGFESGNQDVLELLKKDVTVDDIAEAAEKVKQAEVELSLYALIGAGGRKLSVEHIRDTASFINRVNPGTLEIHTLVLIPNTPLHEKSLTGEFEQISPHECLNEMKALVGNLDTAMAISCQHISNHCNIEGYLPDDKQRLTSELEYCLSIDEESYRHSGLVTVPIPFE